MEGSLVSKPHFMQKLSGKYSKKNTFCLICVERISLQRPSVLSNQQASQSLLMLIGSLKSLVCLPLICYQYHHTQGRQSRLSKLAVISARLGHMKAISNNDFAVWLRILYHMKNVLHFKPWNLADRLRIC